MQVYFRLLALQLLLLLPPPLTLFFNYKAGNPPDAVAVLTSAAVWLAITGGGVVLLLFFTSFSSKHSEIGSNSSSDAWMDNMWRIEGRHLVFKFFFFGGCLTESNIELPPKCFMSREWCPRIFGG